MNKKLIVLIILTIFMLVIISFASAITTNKAPFNKKESPLFGIRLKRSIKEKAEDLIENIKTKFLGERVFFLPYLWLRNKNELPLRLRLQGKTDDDHPTCDEGETCYGWETCDYRPTFVCPATECEDETCYGYETCFQCPK